MNQDNKLKSSDFPSLLIAGFVSVIVNYGGTFILVFQAAKVAGLSPELTTSWVWAVSVGTGLSGLWLSIKYKMPIITAWSTPGAAFLITALDGIPYSDAIGAYLISGAAFLLLGLSGMFNRLIKLIPKGVAAGLLAGILFPFGINAFKEIQVDPVLVCLLFGSFIFLKRFTSRYAILGVLVIGLGFLIVSDKISFSAIEWSLAVPVYTSPSFSLNSLLSVALPLFIVTLTGQYMPGMLVLRNDGYNISANPILTATGLGSLIFGFFGSSPFNVAAITAAIATGKDTHENPKKRFVAGITCGVLYTLVGIFGVTFVALFMAFPSSFIALLAGLALLGTIAGSISNAMEDASTREAALITFLVSAANVSLFGIGGAFWGLVAGLLTYTIIHVKFRIKTVHQEQPLVATKSISLKNNVKYLRKKDEV
ncbi:benzoate/H(+) symporter BenE family transporter [Sphingobacterium psychroaquaticum]|uniref:benzoate/H(+) symporter BenE family transporter n=1 Tax=Sphingobacterium psychroaquaticum TaxID=561061 RepID=UPI0010690982|nr:benzoate/H(+) symporter BenE family transporter [Sphingobacterium psychroaquaticum]QBQ40312.1 benzoate/H(+) symporter BenE family transporter [Sphingobacterium psychroaquaticum]